MDPPTSSLPSITVPVSGDPKLSKERIPGLDGLRAVSILLVVLCHASQTRGFPRSAALDGILVQGRFGVQVFFVISGFIITDLLLREETRTGRISFRNFYIRRAFRILPPALTFLVFIALFGKVTRAELLSCVFFFRNLYRDGPDTGHFWSLAIEEQFYLVWPTILILIPRRLMVRFLSVLIAAAPFWRQLNIKMFGAEQVNWSRADLRYDFIAIGCLVSLLLRTRLRPTLESRIAGSSLTTLLALILTAVTLLAPMPRLVVPFAPSIQAICVASILNAAIQGRPTILNSALNFRPIAWLGLISYSLYLWQEPFCWPPASLSCSFPLNVALALMAATASFCLIEKPTLRLRDRLMAVRRNRLIRKSAGAC